MDHIFVGRFIGRGGIDSNFGGDGGLVTGQDGGKRSLAGVLDTTLDGAVAGSACGGLTVALFGRFVVGHCYKEFRNLKRERRLNADSPVSRDGW